MGGLPHVVYLLFHINSLDGATFTKNRCADAIWRLSVKSVLCRMPRSYVLFHLENVFEFDVLRIFSLSSEYGSIHVFFLLRDNSFSSYIN